MPTDPTITSADVGDAIVLYPPGTTPGSTADHVGIITYVYPNGNIDTVNGDFGGGTDISVKYYTDETPIGSRQQFRDRQRRRVDRRVPATPDI